MAISDWLHRSDHFDWLTAYLQYRGLTLPIRFAMGLVALSIVLIPMEACFVAADRHGLLVMSLYWLSGVGGIAAGYLWLTRWPTRRQSLALAIVGNMTMAFWALTQHDPTLSLLACASMVISGGYFALFHSPRWVLYNLLVAAVATSRAVWQLWATGDRVHITISFWLVFALNVVGPLAVLMLINAFGVDLPHADRDPLTGLLNRRGMRSRLESIIKSAGAKDYLHVTVIDLDGFKHINDTYGHTAGDETLRAVAQILRTNLEEATACRIGGEEFLLFNTAPTAGAPNYTDRIRTQIAALPIQITASIGTSCARLHGIDAEQIDRLIGAADRAMYRAKRLGGNRTCQG